MAKILVIDDDELVVELLKTILGELGHQVLVAMDGMAGPMVAAQHKPDLIVLDFNMPAANGAVVLQRVRGNTWTQATPVLFLSGQALHEVASQVPNDPRVRFLEKPIDSAKMRKALSDLLGAEAAGAPPAAPPSAAPPPGPPAPPPDGEEPPGGGGVVLDLDL